MKNILKRDRRTDVERKFDEQLEIVLDEVESLDDIAKATLLMERRDALRKKGKLSPDTKVIVAGNLIGIVLILAYESGHVITTKALGFIIRGRV